MWSSCAGNRTILAMPTQKGIIKYLNEKVKYREWFRPYGVIVPENKLHEYFDISNRYFKSAPYMSFVFKVKENYKKILQPVIHIDGTCRVQTIDNNIFLKNYLMH